MLPKLCKQDGKSLLAIIITSEQACNSCMLKTNHCFSMSFPNTARLLQPLDAAWFAP